MLFDIETTEEFDTWFDGLRDRRASQSISQNIVKMSGGLFGNVESIGGGISELKVDVGAGYRIYFVVRGRVLIILLTGGDKSSQKRDIVRARELAADL